MFFPTRRGVLHNFVATTPPNVTNDQTQGYSRGSVWFNGSTGVVWFCRDASTGAAVWMPDSQHPGYVAGRLYPTFDGTSATANMGAVDLMFAQVFSVEADVTITALSVWLVVGSGSTGIKGAIYANKYSGTGKGRAFGAPLVADNTGQATTASGAKVDIPAAVTLKRGVAYHAMLKVNSTTPTFTSVGTTNVSPAKKHGRATLDRTTATISVSTPNAYGTNFPTLDGTETWTDSFSNIPVINLQT